MNVSLTPELERVVEDKVKSGLYHTASEVIREAIRLLIERDKLRELRMADLRRDIAVGLEEARRGEFVDPDEVVGRLRKRSQERRRRKA
ncbi:MAG: type II toxin-antitoxin system ParD family antitoxin [Planctomycetota bacterium]